MNKNAWMGRAALAAGFMVWMLGGPFPAFPNRILAQPGGLPEEVQALIEKSGAEVGLAFRTLDGEMELFINQRERFHAASTMKVPVMIELFRQAEEGWLGLDDPLKVENEFASLVDGSPFSVGEEADQAVYARLGGSMPLRELCLHMIAVSSNLATNLLIERLGVENIQSTVEKMGAAGMQVIRPLEDIKAYEKGLSNTTDAQGLFLLMEAIAQEKAVSPRASREMIAILKRQEFVDAIPAGVPEGVEAANKTGEITRIHHDAAIVYGPRPFVLVVLTRGLDDREASAALIASLTRLVYSHSNGD
ncbi:MAG TPA: serine hydrolase [Acidobacteriota bacterium]|nr:serine hydrolase [Acidobacteriota bacterium]